MTAAMGARREARRQWVNFRLVEYFYDLESAGAELVMIDDMHVLRVEEDAATIAAWLAGSDHAEALTGGDE